ncbi:MAG: endonuclease V [Nitrososphaeria archaeon]|nr:endonuclease V [Nitrososphaeria archaeon]
MSRSLTKIDLEKARRIQMLIAKKVLEEDDFELPIKYVGGVDVAFKSKYSIGAVVVLDFEKLNVIERNFYVSEANVPYIPTYLAFREIRVMVGAIKRLPIKPNIFLVDAHGKCHPRRAGEATHLGVLLNIPTIGVAKSYLTGKERADGFIVDNNEVLGYRLKPNVYISVGHKVSLQTAIEIVKKLTVNEIPEPIKHAHIYANEVKNRLII